jgi:hypothetical protein
MDRYRPRLLPSERRRRAANRWLAFWLVVLSPVAVFVGGDGLYMRCGHPESMACGCYGRFHAGEPAPVATREDEVIAALREGETVTFLEAEADALFLAIERAFGLAYDTERFEGPGMAPPKYQVTLHHTH